MRAVPIALMVVGLVVTTTIEATSGEKEDILLAERAIAEIKVHEKADKRAYDRAVKALMGTHDGKEQMRTCPSRNKPYRGLCVTDNWRYKKAYTVLYNRFYKEELKKLRRP